MKIFLPLGIYCVFFCLVCTSVAAKTKGVDSLLVALQQAENDTSKLNTLVALSDDYLEFNLDSAKIVLDLAQQYISTLKPYQAFPEYYNKRANYLMKTGQYSLAEENLIKSSRLADSLGLIRIFFIAKEMQASIQSRLGNHKKAIILAKQLFPVVKKINKDKEYVTYYTNLAIYYIYSGQPDSARFNFRQAYIHTRPNTYHRAAVAVNLAFLNYNLGHFHKTIQYGTESARIAKRLHIDELYLEAVTNISNGNYELGNYDKAVNYSIQVMQLAKKKSLRLQLDNAYGNLAMAYEGKKEYQKALIYEKKYVNLHDSLFNENMSKQINELQIKYETEKKDKDIALKKNKIRVKDIELISLTIGFLLLAGAALFILVLYRKRNKAYMALVKKHLELIASEARTAKETDEKEKIETEKYKDSTLSDERKESLSRKLEKAMQKDKVFLQSDLSLGKLAQRLKINSKYLSQVIHETYRENVTDFINRHRVNEASRLLTDPSYRHISIEGIAEMVGFGSKSTFNAAFKKFTGVTPSFYINAAKTISAKEPQQG